MMPSGPSATSFTAVPSVTTENTTSELRADLARRVRPAHALRDQRIAPCSLVRFQPVTL